MLSTLSSLPGFGLRFAPTFSTGTLGFSRLARRSIFIVVCTLADSLHEPFASRASTGRSFCRIASTASGWNVSCRAGYLPPTGYRRPFHGAPELRPTAPGLPASTCHLFQRLWGIPWVSRVNPWQIRERVDRQVLPLLNNLPLYRNGLRQGSIKDGPRRTGEHEVAFLDAGRQELGGITLGHPYACTQVLQRFQFAIAEAAEAVTGAG